MDLTFTAAEQAFREEVRDYLRTEAPSHVMARSRAGQRLTKPDMQAVHASLFARGWATPAWPVEHGGTGWTPMQHNIFDEETSAAGLPRLSPFGITMCGPVLIEYGSAAQKERFLPTIRSGEEYWCQGYSEPNSGSDLASLQTRAVRDGDHYVVNGQKTWTSFAHWADWIFCLVRTDTEAKPQEGISFLLIDMRSPGITVRPIVTFDGRHEVNEVFLEDVRVPAENLVGLENKGWTYAKYLLSHERTGIAGIGASKHNLARLKGIAAAEQAGGRPLIEDPDFRRKIAELEIDLIALEMSNLRVIAGRQDGPTPLDDAAMLKVRGTEIQQRLTELVFEAVGPAGMPFQPEQWLHGWNEEPVGPGYAATAAPVYFNWRKASIYGGSNEIQKNIVAKMMLS